VELAGPPDNFAYLNNRWDTMDRRGAPDQRCARGRSSGHRVLARWRPENTKQLA